MQKLGFFKGGESLPLARTPLLATPSPRGSAPKTPYKFLYLLQFYNNNKYVICQVNSFIFVDCHALRARNDERHPTSLRGVRRTTWQSTYYKSYTFSGTTISTLLNPASARCCLKPSCWSGSPCIRKIFLRRLVSISLSHSIISL